MKADEFHENYEHYVPAGYANSETRAASYRIARRIPEVTDPQRQPGLAFWYGVGDRLVTSLGS